MPDRRAAAGLVRLGLRVRREDAEPALAALIELFGAGLEETEVDGAVEFAAYGEAGALPAEAAVRAALGPALVGVRRTDVPGGWERAWHAHLRPVDVTAGGRTLRVRPPWAPRHADPAVLDLPVDPGEAFGAGGHATTRMCVELLLDRAPAGALCDWGAGTGVLALAAARLGWAPVIALEHDDAALDVLRANAARVAAGRGIQVRDHDLADTPPPWSPATTANLPRALQLRLASAADRPPETLIASGLLDAEAGEVAAAWAARGLREAARRSLDGWAALLLEGRR
jgi:ribosomal protein L11 methyltransferase